MGRDSSATTSLAPGFRFHPTDEELVSYYLRRKVTGKPFRFDAIADTDIYKTEPWLLPGLSKLKSRDLEWYFFSNLDKKYGNGSRTNRATEEGYWKTTGKDRAVHHKGCVVGMKKTLVYHQGRAPRGQRTNWVMHEYRSSDEELEKAGIPQEAFVLCRIFQKSGTGPKNGEQYGAPLLDEEWEDDNIVAMVPGNLGSDEVICDDAFVQQDDSDQGLDVELWVDVAPDFTDGNNYVNNNYGDSTENEEQSLTGMLENPHSLAFPDGQSFFDVEGGANTVKYEYAPGQMNAINHSFDNSWLEPALVAGTDASFGHRQPSEGAVFNTSTDDGLFLEANDLSEPVDSNPSSDLELLEQYLTYFDAEDDIDQYLSFDSPERFDSKVSLSDQAYDFSQKNIAETEEVASDGGSSSSSSLKQGIVEMPKAIMGVEYSSSRKQVNSWLGNIPAPPAYAVELSSKAIASQLYAAAESSSSSSPVHLTAGMARIRRNMTSGGNAVQWSLDKLGNVNVVFSFDLPESVVLASSPTKMAMASAAVSRGVFYFFFFFFWVLVFAVSVKIGTCVYAK
ncbi:hypothetical protein Dimus_011540 [Dionaea muscipula]